MTDHPISNSQNNNFNPSFSEPNILKHVATSGKKSNSQSRTHPFPTDLRSVPPTLGGQFGQNLDRLSLAPPPQKRRRSTINQIASVTQQQQQKMLKGMQKMKEQHVEPICQQPAQQYQMPQQKSMCHMYPGGTGMTNLLLKMKIILILCLSFLVNPYDQTLQVSSQLNYQHIDDSFNAEYQQRFQQHQNQMYYQHSTASQYYPEQPQQFYHNPA